MDAPLSSPSHQQAQPPTGWPQPQAQAAKSSFSAIPAPPAPRDMPKNNPSTDTFLKDFTLVAEAAKRAQVAVMIRDLENVGLS